MPGWTRITTRPMRPAGIEASAAVRVVASPLPSAATTTSACVTSGAPVTTVEAADSWPAKSTAVTT
ncbi:hypothetical protein [Pengzhenrongella sicca]|uniref:hypothetical protein n=1 Tax=Pengzhenrongella sicca TaxID=2819238 RepID=UPI001D0CB578|nr:hypothetical protein [Pengzhenrongella sicca]